MKKCLFLVCLFALAITGCSYHYGFTETLDIINLTDTDITLIRGIGPTSETEIMQGEKINARESHGRCLEKNCMPDDYPTEHQLLYNMNLKVNGKIVSRKIWERRYWGRSSEVYHATYILTITNELIEEIGFEEEE